MASRAWGKKGHILRFAGFAALITLGPCRLLAADAAAKVTEAVNDVEHGSKESGKTPAHTGTAVYDGQFLQTGVRSRAEMELPSASITRLGANTIFNYSADSNTVDLQEGDILFCKPKDADRDLKIETAAVTAGISGTTGFVSVQGSGHKAVYIFGIIEGHAHATADGKEFTVESGDILEFRPPRPAFMFAFDLPRFVRSSSLIQKFKNPLPNEEEIKAAIDNYNDEVSRGFIEPPKKGIDYSGEIPIYDQPSYDSAQNAGGGGSHPSSPSAPSSPAPSSPATPTTPTSPTGSSGGSPLGKRGG